MLYDVTAVIVTFNPDFHILSSLTSDLLSQNCKVIIVDNNSHNKEHLEIEGVSIISNTINYGLAYAQNQGIKSCLDQSSHVIFFDQDSTIVDGLISNLIDLELNLLSKGNRVAAVGPKFVDRATGYDYPSTRYKSLFGKRAFLDKEPLEVSYLIASGCLIRTSVLKDVGFMWDKLFIDFIDVEWSFRAQSKNYKCFMSPSAVMIHEMGDSRVKVLGRLVSMHSDFRRFYTLRNGAYLLRLPYIPFYYKKIIIIYNLIRTYLGIIHSKKKISTFKNFSKAWVKGFFDKITPP